jgi:O-methyltransferase domain/Dimerisation domain
VTSEAPAARLRRLVSGFQLSQALSVAATLGVADLLADGPRTSGDLAHATDSHPDALYRLLRALAAAGVLHEADGRRFSLTELGEPLRSDAPESVHGWAAYVGRPYYRAAWSNLLHTVRTGENAFRHVHGVDPWTFRAERPDESAIFDRAMESSTRGSIAAVLQAYDFGRFGTIVDVGGGNGALLAALLEAHPAMRGVVFDQPHVVEAAAVLLRECGLSDRCRVEGGSFFDAVPPDGDAYVLKHIVHDWEDTDAVAILRTLRGAARPGAAVLVLERELGAPNESPLAKLADLNMLAVPGGRERTEPEYAALFEAAGLEYVREVRSAAALSVYEASVG